MSNALTFSRYGEVDVLEYKQLPIPAVTSPTHVLVEVKAAGVNPIDWKIRKGFMAIVKGVTFPDAYLGIDYAGIVSEVGSEVKSVKKGDEVYGKFATFSDRGTYAQFTLLDEKVDAIVRKPKNLSFQQAATVGVTGVTAYVQLFEHSKLESGQRVLIIGASGGIGSFAVPFAKIKGVHVTGICSTANVDAVKKLGADDVIDYKKENVKDAVSKLAEFDAIVDAVGSQEYYEWCLPKLKKGGVYSTALPPGGSHDRPISFFDLLGTVGTILWRNNPFSSTSFKFVTGLPIAYLNEINTWLEEGKVKPPIFTTFPLKDGKKAHEASETGRTVGKIVLIP